MRVLFLNPQGNFDKEDSYWTEHPDFGGQLVYVKEIAIEMAKQGVDVDIVTRYIDDPSFAKIQGSLDSYPNVDGVRIVRIPCGPNDRYLRKELLWEHLEEWVDNLIAFYKQTGTAIDVATGHYGDGGLACAMLKQKKGIPYTFTGHSLGAQKFDKLNKNFSNLAELEQQYFFSKRILAERTAIYHSDIVFVSTKQERDEQYQHPLYQDVANHATFEVVPPGANTDVFRPLGNQPISMMMRDIEQRMNRHIAEDRQNKAYIIAASRLDPKKNHLGLLEAYANSRALQERANLVLSVRGIEDVFTDYTQASPSEQAILSSLLDVIRRNNLFGKVAFLNIRTQQELADTYRLLSTKQGIFTLTALYEPFGLAPIEAMSAGLPAVVTKYGGPSDVLQDEEGVYGVLVDALSSEDIAHGLLECLERHDFYQKQGQYRVLTSYTWAISAQRYLYAIAKIQSDERQVVIPRYFYTKNQADLDTTFLRSRYQSVQNREVLIQKTKDK